MGAAGAWRAQEVRKIRVAGECREWRAKQEDARALGREGSGPHVQMGSEREARSGQSRERMT